MARKGDFARVQKGALTADEAEALFATVDHTGHSDEERARRQRAHRREKGVSLDIDPLSEDDPSGSNVGKVITKTAVSFVAIFLVAVVVGQVAFGFLRRSNTANLSSPHFMHLIGPPLTQSRCHGSMDRAPLRTRASARPAQRHGLLRHAQGRSSRSSRWRESGRG